jgi:hypothetical protein
MLAFRGVANHELERLDVFDIEEIHKHLFAVGGVVQRPIPQLQVFVQPFIRIRDIARGDAGLDVLHHFGRDPSVSAVDVQTTA